jgi:hypothetical protein
MTTSKICGAYFKQIIAEANICDKWSTFLLQLIYRRVGAYLGEQQVGTNSWSAGTYFQESGDSFPTLSGSVGIDFQDN